MREREDTTADACSRIPIQSMSSQTRLRRSVAVKRVLITIRATRCRHSALLVLITLVALSGCHSLKAMPEGTSYAGPEQQAHEVTFLADRTWLDQEGQRHVHQEVFDEMFSLIEGARKLIVIDMFLYNDWQGPEPETTRALSSELTERLIRAQAAYSDIHIVVITDPVNTLYSGLTSTQFEALSIAGVQVVQTDLNRLRDSNTFYSPLWRLFFKPFGNGKGRLLPNPIGPGRVSLRTYMKLLNFKANHRKTLIVDQGERLVGFVSSANPHDGSSAHRNTAIRFAGPAVVDLLRSENAVLKMSKLDPVEIPRNAESESLSLAADVTVQVVTEAKIQTAILQSLASTESGDRVDVMMFYLSDRDVIRALIEAHNRGVVTRVMLDPNKDAFGRQKNGVPNRPTARKLKRHGLDLRWCDSHGEQCHAKMILISSQENYATLISGSANFTRRNLDNFNLETDVVLRGPIDATVMEQANNYFDEMWHNRNDRLYSTDYETYRDDSLWHRFLAWFMESSGMSSF